MKIFGHALLGLLAFTSVAAHADDFGLWPALQFGRVASGGTGCLGGSNVRVSYSTLTGEVNIQFLSFRPEASSRSPGLKRQSCNIALPMSPPAGYAVKIIDVEMPVSTQLDSGTISRANLEAFIAGSTGPRDSESFSSSSGTVVKRAVLGGIVGVSSGCGEAVNVRINASATASNSARPSAYVALAIRSAKLRLAFIPCGQ